MCRKRSNAHGNVVKETAQRWGEVCNLTHTYTLLYYYTIIRVYVLERALISSPICLESSIANGKVAKETAQRWGDVCSIIAAQPKVMRPPRKPANACVVTTCQWYSYVIE